MTLVLNLPPDMEAAIQQDAARQGTTPEALALDGLQRLYPAPPGQAAFTPVIPLEALERESLYADEDVDDGDSDMAA